MDAARRVPGARRIGVKAFVAARGIVIARCVRIQALEAVRGVSHAMCIGKHGEGPGRCVFAAVEGAEGLVVVERPVAQCGVGGVPGHAGVVERLRVERRRTERRVLVGGRVGVEGSVADGGVVVAARVETQGIDSCRGVLRAVLVPVEGEIAGAEVVAARVAGTGLLAEERAARPGVGEERQAPRGDVDRGGEVEGAGDPDVGPVVGKGGGGQPR